MKKLLAVSLALVASAEVCFGAAIDWTLSGMNTALTDYAGNTAGKTTVYLVLADNKSIASITDVAGEDAFTTALGSITVATVSSGTDGKKPATTTATFESPLLDAGTSYTFGMLYVSNDTDGNGFYRLLKSQSSVAAYDSSDPSSSQAVSLSWSTMKSAAWTKGYTAVPEPSTVALALAGLALLLKRRKA